jgi:hypothetical protein
MSKLPALHWLQSSPSAIENLQRVLVVVTPCFSESSPEPRHVDQIENVFFSWKQLQDQLSQSAYHLFGFGLAYGPCHQDMNQKIRGNPDQPDSTVLFTYKVIRGLHSGHLPDEG